MAPNQSLYLDSLIEQDVSILYDKIASGLSRREEDLKKKAIELATLDGELRRRELLVANLEK